uniref:hypothetical protein n=1 Tax=Priestia flexa TaxID=86664 RepID=UPI001F2C672F
VLPLIKKDRHKKAVENKVSQQPEKSMAVSSHAFFGLEYLSYNAEKDSPILSCLHTMLKKMQ